MAEGELNKGSGRLDTLVTSTFISSARLSRLSCAGEVISSLVWPLSLAAASAKKTTASALRQWPPGLGTISGEGTAAPKSGVAQFRDPGEGRQRQFIVQKTRQLVQQQNRGKSFPVKPGCQGQLAGPPAQILA